MSSDSNAFAEKIKKIQPRPVSEELQARAITSLNSNTDSRNSFPRSMAVIFAIAALLVMSATIWNYRADSPVGEQVALKTYTNDNFALQKKATSEEFQAVQAKNTLLQRVDEGIVFLNNGISARRFRYQFIDTVTWENPVDGAQISMEVPREEIVLIPVQTF